MKKLKYESPRIRVTANLEKSEDLAVVVTGINIIDGFLCGKNPNGVSMQCIDEAAAEAADQVPDITYQQSHGLTK